jgi:hypothetical protein
MPASTSYHIRIKKSYAAAILQDLQKLDAIELLPESDIVIPESQKKEIRKRIKEMQKHPERLIPWEEARKKFKRLTK